MQDVDYGLAQLRQEWLDVIGGNRAKAAQLFDEMQQASQDKADSDRALDDAYDRLQLVPAYVGYLLEYLGVELDNQDEESPQTLEEFFANAQPEGYDRPDYRTEYMRKAEETTATMAQLVGDLNRLTGTDAGKAALDLWMATGKMLEPIIERFGQLLKLEEELAQAKDDLAEAHVQIAKMSASWVAVLVQMLPSDDKTQAVMKMADKLAQERAYNAGLLAELGKIYELLEQERAASEANDQETQADLMMELDFMARSWKEDRHANQ